MLTMPRLRSRQLTIPARCASVGLCLLASVAVAADEAERLPVSAQTPTLPNEGGDAAPGVGGVFAALTPVIVDDDHEVRMTARSEHVEVAVAYPRLAGGPTAAVGTMVVAQQVGTLLAGFEEDYRGLVEGEDGTPSGPPWALDIGYGEVYAAPGFWSVLLTVYQYSGGAHGSQTAVPMVIARATGELVPPAGLFRADADWLPVLAAACYQDLVQREPFTPDDEWLQQGTAPSLENYAALLPRADGLQVEFQQYQVGPYAIGTFSVLVPYPVLDGLLEPTLFGSAVGE